MSLVIIVLAYLIGSVPFGLVVGKIFYGVDIRQHGSGNLGATNTFRTLGKKAGIIVTLGDILKGTLAASLPVFFHYHGIHPLIIGLIAVIGHMYPIFAGFRGGKAVATSAGILLFASPLLFVALIIIFAISLKITKYVSLSSMLTAFIGTILAFIMEYTGLIKDNDYIITYILIVLTIFVVYKHRPNIKRIREKTEPKVKF
ncbi:glycerol-3-phosphate 1-O-acyltransferase PlsY [Gottfriedia acidiceleris]|uniref:glycerol-3-phosphate 1-O-acyltransferase PlsY n=1 Tax=Gottfriedia acidiceleris TaxID=371036 RepID=UPI000B43E8E1|nr:glycerol-3-phosphate 1-O-acyltransferase PlsY [Gottfriedia acidiceleris]